MALANAKQLVTETLSSYSADHGERLSAALAYYAIFSLAPLLVLVLAVASLLYGRRPETAQAELMAGVETAIGTDGAALLEGLLESASATPTAGTWATVLGGLILVIGATALFARLQEALNTIWGVTPQHSGLTGFLRSRVLSLLLVVGVGIIMIASLVLSSLLAGLANLLAVPILFQAAERLISLATLALLFGVLYRTLPDAPVRWADVWPGALLTAFLVTLGTWALGLYLGRASVTSSFGAAGALVALLIWVYYSAQIFFLGAELTTVYADRRTVSTLPEGSRGESSSALSSGPEEPQTQSATWRHRVGWVALGIALALFFRR